jgi:hypothetical protein
MPGSKEQEKKATADSSQSHTHTQSHSTSNLLHSFATHMAHSIKAQELVQAPKHTVHT